LHHKNQPLCDEYHTNICTKILVLLKKIFTNPEVTEVSFFLIIKIFFEMADQ